MNTHTTKNQEPRTKNLAIGVLALQGDFLEHILALQRIGVNAIEVKLPEDLLKIDGIILPGGESTTMARLLDAFGLREPLVKKINEGLPAWGTCAGMILLSKKIIQDKIIPLGILDITVNRNAYGRQIDSFEVPLVVAPLGKKVLQAVFIRSPKIEKLGAGVEVLSKLDNGTVVAIKQGRVLATAFHSELSMDTRLHEYFISLIE